MNGKRVVYDVHSHTYLCGHAEMVNPKVMEAVAYAQGMRGYAFCDHNPFPNDDVTPEYRMLWREYPLFLKNYKLCKEFAARNWPEFELTLNMEVDYHPADPQKTYGFVKQTSQYDCLLGSLHYYFELPTIQTT